MDVTIRTSLGVLSFEASPVTIISFLLQHYGVAEAELEESLGRVSVSGKRRSGTTFTITGSSYRDVATQLLSACLG